MAKKLRFKVGDRVTCARGFCIGASRRIARRAPSSDWVVRFDKPVVRGGSELKEAWLDDSELESWAVPPEARPLSVGALHHSEVTRG